MKCIIRFFLGISLPMLMTNGVPAATEPAANPPKRVARVFDDGPQSEHADWHRLPAGDTLRLPFDKLWAVSPSKREAAATQAGFCFEECGMERLLARVGANASGLPRGSLLRS